MIEVELPDGTIAEFPASMSNADIESVLARQFGQGAQPAPQMTQPAQIAGPSLQVTNDLPAKQPQVKGSQYFKEGFNDLPIDQQQQVIAARENQLSAVGMPSNIQSAAVKRDKNLTELKNTAPKDQQFAKDLPEIGAMPELNQFSLDAVKRSLAANLITDEVELAKALQLSIPNSSISQDPEGNALLTTQSGTYAINKPGLSGQDFAQFAMRLAAFTPAGRIAGASVKQLAKGALAASVTEGGLQATEKALGGDFDAGEVATAAAVAPVAQAVMPIAQGGKRIFSALRGKAIQATPEQELVKLGGDTGVPVFTSDVLEPQTFIGRQLREVGERIPILGTGEWRAAQQKFRQMAVDDVAEKYSEYSYDAIITSLKNQKNRIKQAAGSVLSETTETLDDFGRVSLDNTESAINKLKEALNKPGVMKSAADDMAINEADSLLTTMSETGQIFSTLKENRTAFREIIKGVDKAERSQLTSKAKALLENVQSGMKSDMDKFARQHLTPQKFQKWSKANAVYAEEARNLTRSKLKNILDKGDVTPETVKGMLFSRNPSELKLLHKSLTSEGRSNARAAVIGKVFDDLSRRQNGITPNAFATEIRKYKPQIDVLFKGEEKKALVGLQKVLQATRRAQDAAVTTPTGLGLYTGALAFGGATLPIETLAVAGSIGTAAKLYENTVVRNALVRLASVPKTSSRFSQSLDEAVQALSLAAATTQSKQSE